MKRDADVRCVMFDVQRVAAHLLVILLALLTPALAAAEEVTIQMKAAPGLRFDPVRFAVPPGAKVKLVIENIDVMQYNLLITQPGARVDVVTEAMALGADGPKMEFVPKTEKVLHASKMLGPGATQTIEFTAPTKQDVYPYVCTNVGHGFLMYGAMYVTSDPKSLPPEEGDPHLPPPLPMAIVDHSQHHDHGPRVQRTFMPDAGPAAIAVDVGGGNSYCFDAGQCRLRYAWIGGFINASEHLASSGDVFTEIVGRIWWRAGDAFPLHIGAPESPGSPGNKPKVAWHGYKLIDGLPEFRYSVDGVEVREIIKPRPATEGGGLLRQFTLQSPGQTVYFITESGRGATFESSAGQWQNNVLRLTAAEARQFTIAMTPVSGVHPMAYWSMNDSPRGRGGGTVPGVVGRAVPFDGKKQKELPTKLNLKDLAGGSTILLWFKPDAKQTDQVILGGRNGEREFLVGYQLTEKGKRATITFDFANRPHTSGTGKLGSFDPTNWTPLAIVINGDSVSLLTSGSVMSMTAGPIEQMDIDLYLASAGNKQFFRGAIDEVRVYDRVMNESEIRQIFDGEAPGNKEVRR